MCTIIIIPLRIKLVWFRPEERVLMHHWYRNANTSSLWYGDIIDLYGRATSTIHPTGKSIIIISSSNEVKCRRRSVYEMYIGNSKEDPLSL